MFHGHQFRAPVMSPFFHPHEPYDDITLDDMRSPFHPPMYPSDGEFDSYARLTPTYSVESNPSKPSYPSVIHLTSDSSSSATIQTPPQGRVLGFIHTRVVSHGHGRAREGGCGDDAPGVTSEKFC